MQLFKVSERFFSEIEEKLLSLKLKLDAHELIQALTVMPVKRQLDCPKFSGMSIDDKFSFRTFLKKFEFCTDSLNKADRLLVLKSKLDGDAFDIISSLDVTSDNLM